MFEKFKALFNLKNLTVLGLILNMVGSVLIWQYGIPSVPIKDNGVLILARHDSKENEISHQNEIDRCVFLSNLGMGLLAGGFFLQFMAAIRAEKSRKLV